MPNLMMMLQTNVLRQCTVQLMNGLDNMRRQQAKCRYRMRQYLIKYWFVTFSLRINTTTAKFEITNDILQYVAFNEFIVNLKQHKHY